MFSDVIATIGAIGAVATAIAVFIAIAELRAAKDNARTAFEDDLSREYRSIIGQLPAEAFYAEGDAFTPDDEARRAFYRYIDLSNEQLFLARNRRVSPKTAEQWMDGIRGNLEKLPAFKSAWGNIAAHVPDDFFEDLRELVPPTSSSI
jgi:hypothetical protein